MEANTSIKTGHLLQASLETMFESWLDTCQQIVDAILDHNPESPVKSASLSTDTKENVIVNITYLDDTNAQSFGDAVSDLRAVWPSIVVSPKDGNGMYSSGNVSRIRVKFAGAFRK